MSGREAVPARHSAEILRFPAPPPAVGQRLHRALDDLTAALATQRQAIADWRRALGELQATVGGLGASLRHCDSSLARVGQQAATAGEQARRLERWADTVADGIQQQTRR